MLTTAAPSQFSLDNAALYPKIFNLLLIQTLIFVVSIRTYHDDFSQGIPLFLIGNKAYLMRYIFLKYVSALITLSIPLSLFGIILSEGFFTADKDITFLYDAGHFMLTSCLMIGLSQTLSLVCVHQRTPPLISFFMIMPLLMPSFFLTLMNSARHAPTFSLSPHDGFLIHLGLFITLSTMLSWIKPRLLHSAYEDADHAEHP